MFSPFDDDYLRSSEPAYLDWLQTLDYVKDKFYLPKLNLRGYMADHQPSEQGVTPFRSNTTKEQGMTILKIYGRTRKPLLKLRGMDRFFVHLAWPFARTCSVCRARKENPEVVKQQTTMMKERIRRLVMGNSYNSMLLNKQNQRNSQWLEASQASTMYDD